MPELPEVEHLRRTLEPLLVGSRVLEVSLLRRDVWQGERESNEDDVEEQLLRGQRIVRLLRHGKQLGIEAASGRVLCVHLGMSGQLLVVGESPGTYRSHVHCSWRLKGVNGSRTLLFRDPRRFGGLWTFTSVATMQEARWRLLGPDALTVSVEDLRDQLKGSTRPIKAALLDQRIIAGVGNIYADEALFLARIHPATLAGSLSRKKLDVLGRTIEVVLREAIDHGGSTIASYADANGDAGTFAERHRVYGRSGLACRVCGAGLRSFQLAQRTTTYCPKCQRR